MKLDPRDQTVQFYTAAARQKIEPLRLALERPGATLQESEYIRGQIKVLRWIAGLPEEVNNGKFSLRDD